MKEGGWALVSLGFLLLLGAMLVDVSVDVGYVPASPYLPSLPREVANLHAMHVQALIVQGGLASIICGTISIGFGTIVEAMRKDQQAPPEEPVQPRAAEPFELPPSGVPEFAENQPDGLVRWVVGVSLFALLVIAFLWVFASVGQENGNASANGVQEAFDAANAAANDLDNAATELDRARGRVR